MIAQSKKTQLKVLPRRRASQLEQAVDMFLLDGRARRLSPRTVKWYGLVLAPFVAHVTAAGVTDVDGITPSHIRAYLVTLAERNLAPNTQNGAARSIKAFLNFCVNEDLLTASPMRKVKMPEPGRELLPAFTPAEVSALIGACRNPRETALVLCLLDTGARAAEFVALNVGDVDDKLGSVAIQHGKGDKGRYAFLGAKATKSLKRYLMTRKGVTDDDPLWVSERRGDRLSQHALAMWLKRLGERAGVDDVHPHKFRRTFALFSLQNGCDLISLARLMGHSDLTVLRRYLDQQREHLQRKHTDYGPVDHMT